MSAESTENTAQMSLEKDWEPSGEIKGDYLNGIVRIPGYWESKDKCEELSPVGWCENAHTQLGAAQPCRSRTCPHHWYLWRQQAAVNAVSRIAGYRAAQVGAGKRLAHVVTAPEQGQRWTPRRLWEQRSKSYEIAEEAGGRGGMTVPHPFRVSDAGEAMWEAVTEEGDLDPEYGKWRFIRDSSERWEDLEPLIEVAPHGHHMMPVEDLDGGTVAEIEEETGWVVKNIRALPRFYATKEDVPPWELVDENGVIQRSREDVVREGYEAMVKVTMYLLSHAGVQTATGDFSQRQTVTYWGELNTFDPEEELEAERWETIQRTVAEMVGEDPDLEDDEVSAGDLCQIDGCEAEVHDLRELEDWLARVSWVEGLPPERAWEMWGLKVLLNDNLSPGGPTMGDRPPPGGFERSPRGPDTRDPTEYREWLVRLGRRRIKQNPFYQIGEPVAD